jgi:hypothetical protein
LLDRFLSFVSGSNNGKKEKENKSLASMVEVLEKHGLKGCVRLRAVLVQEDRRRFGSI